MDDKNRVRPDPEADKAATKIQSAFRGFKTRAGQVGKKVKTTGGKAYEKSREVKGVAVVMDKGKAVGVAGYQKGKVVHAAAVDSAVGQTVISTYQKVEDKIEEKKEDLRALVTLAIERKVDAALDKVGNVALRNAKDPDMPRCVQTGVDRAFGGVWPDVKEEVAAAVMHRFREEVPPERPPPPSCFPNPFKRIRAFILYHLYPFDKSIWKMLRDPWYYILFLITIFPVFGVPQVAYLILFLLKDKKDEFQLTNFIIAFKGIQFLTLGVISTIIGATQYVFCLNMQEESQCDQDGPRVEYWELSFFLLQIILVWLAYFLLPFSHKKGGRVYKVRGRAEKEFDTDGDGMLSIDELTDMREELNRRRLEAQASQTNKKTDMLEDDTAKRTDRGGLLRSFLLYDLFIFVVMAGLALAFMFSGGSGSVTEDGLDNDNWRLRATFFWLKTLYGILSFPFIIFKLPVFSSILTHAKATGYNRAGQCTRKLAANERSTSSRPRAKDFVV